MRNGLFGKKVRILLKNTKNDEFIDSGVYCFFYSGVYKKISSFENGITLWIPKNRVSSLVVVQDDKTVKYEKINSGVETEKVIGIKIAETTNNEKENKK